MGNRKVYIVTAEEGIDNGLGSKDTWQWTSKIISVFRNREDAWDFIQNVKPADYFTGTLTNVWFDDASERLGIRMTIGTDFGMARAEVDLVIREYILQ